MNDVYWVNEIELNEIWILFVDKRNVVLKFCFKYKFSVNDCSVKVNYDSYIDSNCKCFIECVWNNSIIVDMWIFCFDKELDSDVIINKNIY